MPSSESEILEEIDLLAPPAAGDREAFRQLYARYRAALFSLAIRFVGDAGAAEENLQDAFVKIWRHAAGYDARKSRPFTWAVTILRRTCIDHLRKQGRIPPASPLPGDDAAPAEFAARETVRQAAEMRETTARLHEALAAVAPLQRAALELALFSTLTYAEIAARLAQPEGTVKTWIRRGLLELRATLKETTP
ncbi:MAG: RNA polymerase sigma factor [Lacunisphaera sp.]